ncbi:unnamed protein product [Protopolystoma xenopodis]|uniref:Uncharacterized protein n=1 Tax=Protopolystoma xenopodis TaxID=117903 RepID=A0A3S5FFU7_9PLAT|nr:unnamed protein product [Protopolystoma xenopodis]
MASFELDPDDERLNRSRSQSYASSCGSGCPFSLCCGCSRCISGSTSTSTSASVGQSDSGGVRGFTSSSSCSGASLNLLQRRSDSIAASLPPRPPATSSGSSVGVGVTATAEASVALTTHGVATLLTEVLMAAASERTSPDTPRCLDTDAGGSTRPDSSRPPICRSVSASLSARASPSHSLPTWLASPALNTMSARSASLVPVSGASALSAEVSTTPPETDPLEAFKIAS